VRATGRLNKLYLELLKENPDWAQDECRADMNHFMARLVFCFIASVGGAVRVVLYAPRRFADMTPQERVRACYQHAALKYVSGQRMKNSTLSERLGIDSQNAAQTSMVIRQSLQAELIKSADPAHPRAGYIPFWA
jgi:hypothetical protein